MDDRLLHKKEGFLVVVMPGGNLVGNSRLKFPTLLGTSQPKNSIEVPGTTYSDIAPWAIFKNKNMYIEHHITFWIKKKFWVRKTWKFIMMGRNHYNFVSLKMATIVCTFFVQNGLLYDMIS